MYPYNQPYGVPGQGSYAGRIEFSAVLRQVYLWLSIGLLVSFGVALTLGQQLLAGSPVVIGLYQNPIVVFGSIIVYIGVGFAFYPVVRRASAVVGTALFLVFTALFGFMIASIFAYYTAGSIASTFLVTALMFALMTLVGYTTRLDLSKFGALFLTALIGVIIASVVNIFLQSSVLYWIITIVAILVFTGLIAFDTQWIKRQAMALSSSPAMASASEDEIIHRVALLGAFRLFLDFVNLFLYLLRIFGRNR